MDNLEYFEKYLNNQLSEEEQSAFERRLQNDDEFRKEFEITRNLITGIESNALKKELNSRQIPEEKQANIRSISSERLSIRRSLAIAASLAIILVCGWFIYQNSSTEQNEMLAEIFYPDPGLPTPMSDLDDYNFYDAMVDYKMERYAVARDKWEQLDGNIGLDTVRYYIAMTELNLGNYSSALSDLKEINQESAFYQQAQWRKVQIYIEREDYEKAREILESLPPGVNEKYEELMLYLKDH